MTNNVLSCKPIMIAVTQINRRIDFEQKVVCTYMYGPYMYV